MRIRPLRELEAPRYDRKQARGLTIKSAAGHRLKEINGDALELTVVFKAPAAKECGVDVLCAPNGENGLRIAVLTEATP